MPRALTDGAYIAGCAALARVVAEAVLTDEPASDIGLHLTYEPLWRPPAVCHRIQRMFPRTFKSRYGHVLSSMITRTCAGHPDAGADSQWLQTVIPLELKAYLRAHANHMCITTRLGTGVPARAPVFFIAEFHKLGFLVQVTLMQTA